MSFAAFMVVWLGLVALVLGGCLMIAHYDYLVVFLMRRFHLHLYPTAIGIAMLLIDHPEQWSSDGFRLSHPDIGSIWIANSAYGLKVETAFGSWVPDKIERRIIRDAVDWRIGEYIRNRLQAAVAHNALR